MRDAQPEDHRRRGRRGVGGRGNRVRGVTRLQLGQPGRGGHLLQGAGPHAAEHGGPERNPCPQADPQHHRVEPGHRHGREVDQRLDGPCRPGHVLTEWPGRHRRAGSAAVLPGVGARRPGRGRTGAEADPRCLGGRSGHHGQLLLPADAVRTGPVAGAAPLPQLDSRQSRVGHRLARAGDRVQGGHAELGGTDHRTAGRTDDVVRLEGSDVRPPSRRTGPRFPTSRPGSRSSRWTARCPRASRRPS